MMTCKEVATLLSTGELDHASWLRRLAVRLHLAMCDRCAAFKRQLDAMARAAAALGRRLEADAPADLEARVVDRVTRTPGAPDRP